MLIAKIIISFYKVKTHFFGIFRNYFKIISVISMVLVSLLFSFSLLTVCIGAPDS